MKFCVSGTRGSASAEERCVSSEEQGKCRTNRSGYWYCERGLASDSGSAARSAGARRIQEFTNRRSLAVAVETNVGCAIALRYLRGFRRPPPHLANASSCAGGDLLSLTSGFSRSLDTKAETLPIGAATWRG